MSGHIHEQSKKSLRIKVALGKDPVTGKYTSHYETVRGVIKETPIKDCVKSLPNWTGAFS